MKFFFSVLLSILLVSSFFNFSFAQVIDSTYTQEEKIEKEVEDSGVVLGGKIENNDEVQEGSFQSYDIINVAAIIGGIILVVLFGYIAYLGKENE